MQPLIMRKLQQQVKDSTQKSDVGLEKEEDKGEGGQMNCQKKKKMKPWFSHYVNATM